MTKQIQKTFLLGLGVFLCFFLISEVLAGEVSGILGTAGLDTGLDIDTQNCSSVAHGTVAADYPTCTLTCDSGYSKDGNTCVAKHATGGGYTPITTTTTTTTTKPISQMTPAEIRVEITRLAALVVLLQAQLKEMMGGPSAISSIPESFKFTKDLQFGQVLIDVKYLQIVLNSDSATMVASIGPGSPGNETNYFGVLTKAAVIKFQVKYKAEILTPLGLTAGTGYVGPSTIKKLNELLK